ncbi:spike base protein, RCAP_Rcc01079 family [Methylobacterium oryzisoli]|uniref:spike base protein, RCAP_Rcc01079 family n=1 Tax=Methylobacterium oryzisoli TaxID=3385502 RepID=UPI00397A1AE1
MTAIDPFYGYPSDRNGPFDYAAEITPSDDHDLEVVASCILIADTPTFVDGPVDGYKSYQSLSLKVTTAGGDIVTLNTFGGATLSLLRVRKVWATGTTVQKLVAFW